MHHYHEYIVVLCGRICTYCRRAWYRNIHRHLYVPSGMHTRVYLYVLLRDLCTENKAFENPKYVIISTVWKTRYYVARKKDVSSYVTRDT